MYRDRNRRGFVFNGCAGIDIEGVCIQWVCRDRNRKVFSFNGCAGIDIEGILSSMGGHG